MIAFLSCLTYAIIAGPASGWASPPILALFTVAALTNVFKHAFPEPRQDGTITVRLAPAEGGMLRLAVEDNGEGYDSKDTVSSVGAKLIQTFGRQVGGHSGIRSVPGEGTVAELVFPDPAIHRGEDHLYGEP